MMTTVKAETDENPLVVFADAVQGTIVDAAHTVNAGVLDSFKITVEITKQADGDLALHLEFDPPLKDFAEASKRNSEG